MSKERKGRRRLPDSPALRFAAVAVLTAVTIVFTIVIRIPVAPTRGYLNLSDVAIYFTAFTLGPLTALIAGGLGTGLADVITGVGLPWGPISLFVHGLQGLLAALVAAVPMGGRGRWPVPPAWLVAGGVGTLVMCGGYFAAGAVMFGAGAALVELPGNLLQNVAGLVAGIPLSLAVRKAYPPVAELRW
jgi:uncharacterized membrane protein